MKYNYLYNVYKIYSFLASFFISYFFKNVFFFNFSILYNIILLYLKFNKNLKIFNILSFSKFFFYNFFIKHIFNIKNSFAYKASLFKLYINDLNFLISHGDNINLSLLNQFFNFSINKNISFSYKYYFRFSILNNSNKKIKLKKISNNLFSLFIFNLFIYLFLVYLFIYWVNGLFSFSMNVSNIFVMRMLDYSKKLFFYKAYFDYNLRGRNFKYKKFYYLNSVNISSYYLIYSKFNLFKVCNI
jgi:hypothetical protein